MELIMKLRWTMAERIAIKRNRSGVHLAFVKFGHGRMVYFGPLFIFWRANQYKVEYNRAKFHSVANKRRLLMA